MTIIIELWSKRNRFDAAMESNRAVTSGLGCRELVRFAILWSLIKNKSTNDRPVWQSKQARSIDRSLQACVGKCAVHRPKECENEINLMVFAFEFTLQHEKYAQCASNLNPIQFSEFIELAKSLWHLVKSIAFVHTHNWQVSIKILCSLGREEDFWLSHLSTEMQQSTQNKAQQPDIMFSILITAQFVLLHFLALIRRLYVRDLVWQSHIRWMHLQFEWFNENFPIECVCAFWWEPQHFCSFISREFIENYIEAFLRLHVPRKVSWKSTEKKTNATSKQTKP